MEKNIEILLINGSTKEQDIFSFALNTLKVSYTCRFAKDAKSAMKIISSNIPDYIFIDGREPRLDSVINSSRLKKTSVIVYADDEAEKNKRSHTCTYIHKTWVIAELMSTLRSIFMQPFIPGNVFRN